MNLRGGDDGVVTTTKLKNKQGDLTDLNLAGDSHPSSLLQLQALAAIQCSAC
jgi:hypothetical protein